MNTTVIVGVLATLLAGYMLPYQQFSHVTPNCWQVWASNSSGLFSDVQSKLKALEAAHEAGVLTDAEYASKKAELEAQLRAATPPVDEATKQKLQALEAAHQAGVLSDEEYARKKAELLGQPPKEKGKVYRHAAGFSFRYPDDWTVTEQEGVIQLVPPNAVSTAEGPMELYFLAVEDISEYSIQRPDDPMVLEYLDQQVLSLSPALQRTGTISSINMRAGKGAIVDWAASGTGGEVRARAFVGIIKNNGVILMGMGLKERVEARDQTLRQMFNSLGVGDPQPAVTASTPRAQEQAGMATSSEISAGEAGDPNWGFKFRPPEGWKFQKTDAYILLGHDTIAGAIFVLPHMTEGLQAVQTEMQGGLSEESVQLFPTGALQPLGDNAIAGEYAGTADGQQVKARGIGTFSPYGGGAYIVAMVVPDKYGPQLSGAADAIARGMQYFKVDVSDLIQHFTGTWASATKSTLTNITLGPGGVYDYAYEAGYYGDFRNDVGDKTGFWDATGTNQNKGRWTVRGNKRQGVIIIKLQDGTEQTLEYKVHVEKGETYWNEYWFNGSHYSRTR
jgi:hypothetical protein